MKSLKIKINLTKTQMNKVNYIRYSVLYSGIYNKFSNIHRKIYKLYESIKKQNRFDQNKLITYYLNTKRKV